MNTFNINNKDYKAKEFDFNLVCDLQDMGVSLEDAEKKPMSMIRAYFALCADISVKEAGNEMGNHLADGGSLDGLLYSMQKEMEDSDFFRRLNKTEEKETTTDSKKARKKNTEI